MKVVNLYGKIDIEGIVEVKLKNELAYIYKLLQNLTDRFNCLREENIVLNKKLEIALASKEIPDIDKSRYIEM